MSNAPSIEHSQSINLSAFAETGAAGAASLASVLWSLGMSSGKAHDHIMLPYHLPSSLIPARTGVIRPGARRMASMKRNAHEIGVVDHKSL
ncbi:hypothetical protein EJ03DRAFT_206035 [Teratosphaeria nubilosa]|uniref:Uncharacterized protein n=1 Tax=Teratosphaeria nubilosa TaxID=161662 RepID=A0A6G1KZX2_9PEZI|nr:hypothetical protein EJ03DRAFT_206035 [Teratosphaeria nubilosa]